MKGNQIVKTRHSMITTILLALSFLAFGPIVQAVTPPPDGGYPGANTAEGDSALLSLASGAFNTAVSAPIAVLKLPVVLLWSEKKPIRFLSTLRTTTRLLVPEHF